MRGLVACAVMVAVLALAAYAVVSYKPAKDDSPPSARYLQVRAICEAKATRELDPLYSVGGNHWVDAVNHCMTELWND